MKRQSHLTAWVPIRGISPLLTTLFLVLCSSSTMVAQLKVRGTVLDESDKTPLIGVNILIKGTGSGTQTDLDGNYELEVPDAASVLVFSYTGMASQEFTVGNQTQINVLMSSQGIAIQELVVVGYGTQRKKDLTGAVSTISSKDFVKGAIQSPEQLISGKVAGVQISNNGGAPGAGSRIRIRGGSSLNASNDPLIVIDGVPVDNGGVSGSSNPLNLINPNDIENVTILKDPSAAAIYGSRASNGVILVTTKKGQSGKPVINVGAQFFVQMPSSTVDVLSADQIRDIVAKQGEGADAKKLGTANTNWQDEIFQPALGQDVNLSASGTVLNGKLPLRFSAGFLNQDGILKGGNFQRQTAGINLSPKFLNNSLKVDLNIKGARTTNRFANEGAIGGAVSFDPTQPVRVESPRFGGFFTYIDENQSGKPPRDLSPANPLSLLELEDNNSEVYRSIGNLQLNYDLPAVKGLRFNLNLGYDISSGNGTDIVSDSASQTYRRWEVANNPFRIVHAGGRNNEYKSERNNVLWDFYTSYTKDLTSINSKLEVMGGTGFQRFRFTNFNYPDRRFDGSIIPGSEPIFPTDEPSYALLSYYGRLNYTLADKYVLTANFRTDATSRFSPDTRWGYFPSVAVAWRIGEEEFLKGTAVSDLKLRFGWGVTGQQDGISFYGYLPSYSLSNNAAQYQFGDQFINLYRPSAYDPNLRWETTENYNAAIDFAFFDFRVKGSIDAFYRITEDLLSVVPIALGTNFSNQLLTNVGNIESRGVELSLDFTPIRNDRITWDWGFNFTYVDPKITKLLLNPDPSFKGNQVGGISGGTGNNIQIHSVGERPSSFYVYKQIYDQNGKPIEGLYEDLNRDGIINDNDRYRYNSPDPRMFMGLNSNITVGKWSAGFVSRFNIGNYMYNNIQSNNGVLRQIINPLGWLGNASANYLETGFANNQYISDYYVKNASFFRVDNANVGYNAGEVMKGTNLRLSLNVQNALVITNYDGLDPEVNGGIDNQVYPRPRTFALGLNFDF